MTIFRFTGGLPSKAATAPKCMMIPDLSSAAPVRTGGPRGGALTPPHRDGSANGRFSSRGEGSSEPDCLVERGDLGLGELAVTTGRQAVEAQGAELGPDQA